MGRRKKGNPVHGWINLDKPAGMTSTQAVGKVRWLFQAQKAGHAGTLDPLATGILPIALGEATKTIPYIQDAEKIYTFRIIWGEARTTDDAEGDICETSDVRPSKAEIEAILPDFTGEITQIPPQFSAIKIEGQRAYDLARKGETVDIKPRQVYIDELILLDCTKDGADFEVVCGKGTYMRSLARDIAKKLGTCGHLIDLRREAVGPFATENAISLDFLENLSQSPELETALLPVESGLDDIPALDLVDSEAARLLNGQPLNFVARHDVERLRAIGLGTPEIVHAMATCKGQPIAIVTIKGTSIRSKRVLNL